MDVVFGLFALLFVGVLVLRMVFAVSGATTKALDKVADRPGVQAPPFSPRPKTREMETDTSGPGVVWWLPPGSGLDESIGDFFGLGPDGEGVDGAGGDDGGGGFDGGGGDFGGGF